MRHSKPILASWLAICCCISEAHAVNVSDEKIGKPEPAGYPGDWITSQDFPIVALLNGHEGITGFKLSIDEAGKVVSCEITQSSGDKLLDDKTCELMISRAGFTPARDKRGTAIASEWNSRVRWKIPVDLTDSDNSRSRTIEIVMRKDGTVESCNVVQVDKWFFKNHLTADPCAQHLGKRLFTPGDVAAFPRLKMRVRESVEFEGADEPAVEP